jgi:hypothetical protein
MFGVEMLGWVCGVVLGWVCGVVVILPPFDDEDIGEFPPKLGPSLRGEFPPKRGSWGSIPQGRIPQMMDSREQYDSVAIIVRHKRSRRSGKSILPIKPWSVFKRLAFTAHSLGISLS